MNFKIFVLLAWGFVRLVWFDINLGDGLANRIVKSWKRTTCLLSIKTALMYRKLTTNKLKQTQNWFICMMNAHNIPTYYRSIFCNVFANRFPLRVSIHYNISKKSPFKIQLYSVSAWVYIQALQFEMFEQYLFKNFPLCICIKIFCLPAKIQFCLMKQQNRRIQENH